MKTVRASERSALVLEPPRFLLQKLKLLAQVSDRGRGGRDMLSGAWTADFAVITLCSISNISDKCNTLGDLCTILNCFFPAICLARKN